MTNLELPVRRCFLMLTVSEASKYIGKTDTKTWIAWGQSVVFVAKYVDCGMQDLKNS